MRRFTTWLMLILGLFASVACQRRELTYNYNPTCEVQIDVDWSNMSQAPTGMSIYCYPEDGGDPTIVQSNTTSTATVSLPAGVYNILIFNQIPSEYGGVEFVGLESFETAEIKAAATTSKWATSKAESDLVSEPEELAAATYLDLEITDEQVRSTIELRSKSDTKADIEPVEVIALTPKVVTKTTRVRVRLSGAYNHLSTRATLYGMATGYSFADQKSHSDMATHTLEAWSLDSYDGYSEGEVWTYFTSFGLPEFTTTTRVYEDWEGVMDLEILLVDNSTIITSSIPLADKIVVSSSASQSGSRGEDIDLDLDFNVDINITSGFGDEGDGDDPIVLPDVEPVGGSESGFNASIDDWGNKEQYEVEI